MTIFVLLGYKNRPYVWLEGGISIYLQFGVLHFSVMINCGNYLYLCFHSSTKLLIFANYIISTFLGIWIWPFILYLNLVVFQVMSNHMIIDLLLFHYLYHLIYMRCLVKRVMLIQTITKHICVMQRKEWLVIAFL